MMGIPIRTISVLLLIVMMIATGFSGGQSDGGVRDGEPLHLWFRRSPSQNITTLSFYEPVVSDDDRMDIRYRHAIGPKDTPGLELITFFPTHPDSNFLQFEFNGTLTGNYSLILSAAGPITSLDTVYKLRVTIDLDIERDGEYDKQISFLITGTANSSSDKHTGNISVPDDLLKKFDGRRGGRIRVTMSREDDLDTYVILYCGYLGKQSFINLPYSRYTYVPPGEVDNSIPTIWIIGFGSVFIILVVFIAVFLSRKHEKDEPAEEVEPRRSRRRNR